MKLSDIGRYQWIKVEKWLEKWYSTEVLFHIYAQGVDPLARLFTPGGFNIATLNTQWFYERESIRVWDRDYERAVARGVPFLATLVKKSEQYIREAEKILRRVERAKAKDTLVSEVKRALTVLWFVFDADVGSELYHFINNELTKKGFTEVEIDEIKNYYFTLREPLAYQKEQNDLRRIATLYRKNFPRPPRDFSLLPSKIRNLLIAHTRKYRWLSNIDIDTRIATVEDYFTSFRTLFSSKPVSNTKPKLPATVRSRLGVETQKFLRLVNRHIFLDNYGLDLYVRIDFLFQEFLVKKFGISFRDLSWYTFTELERLMREGRVLTRQELAERRRFRAMVEIDGEVAVFYGNTKFEKIRRLMEKRTKLTRPETISGLIASKGYAKGRARVVRGAKDVGKVHKGDILIATTTRPDLMAAILRAQAIVTDWGGITSHAAIISRELGIPCIVHTKVATQALHDGDMIEVDANKGVVRILKRFSVAP